MTSDEVRRCSMCEAKDMVLAKAVGGGETEYYMCPNCDHPRGRMINNGYDGVGPKKNTV